MSEETVLVRNAKRPESRARIPKAKYDQDLKNAKAANQPAPWILDEDGDEGGKSFDQLSKAEQDEAIEAQKERKEKHGE